MVYTWFIWWMKDIYVFHLIQCDQVLFNNPFWSSLSFEVFEMSSQIDCTHATPHSLAWLYRNYTFLHAMQCVFMSVRDRHTMLCMDWTSISIPCFCLRRSFSSLCPCWRASVFMLTSAEMFSNCQKYRSSEKHSSRKRTRFSQCNHALNLDGFVYSM